MLKVNEIFYSIQGESSFIGYPFVFVRLTGCNLRCTYCDTKYAYEEGIDLVIEKIIEEVKKYNCTFVEVTGGEPLLQEETPLLVNSLIKEGFTVLIETNGTKDIGLIPKNAIIIMDIKCPSSGESDKTLWENLKKLKNKDEIKFVLATEEDYNWAKEIIIEKKLEEKRVLFSPVKEKISPALVAEWILKDKINVRLQLQLHKILWPKAKRGR